MARLIYVFILLTASTIEFCLSQFMDGISITGNPCQTINRTSGIISHCTSLELRFVDSTNINVVISQSDTVVINSFSNYNHTPKHPEINLLIENVKNLKIHKGAFNQMLIHAVFTGIGNLFLEEKSFLSCWGSVWIINDHSDYNLHKCCASSDLTVWVSKNRTFDRHERPPITPRQKMYYNYPIHSKLEDYEVHLYALLAVIVAVVLTLIALSVIVCLKVTRPNQSSAQSAEDPFITKGLANAQVKQRKGRNPVTKLSRLSATFHGKVQKKRTKPTIEIVPLPPRPRQKNVQY